jgi:hypothetical protein
MIFELLSQASVDFWLVAVMFSRSTTRQCTNIVLAIIQSYLILRLAQMPPGLALLIIAWIAHVSFFVLIHRDT